MYKRAVVVLHIASQVPRISHFIFMQLKWSQPDEDGLVQFLVEEKGFRYYTRRVHDIVGQG